MGFFLSLFFDKLLDLVCFLSPSVLASVHVYGDIELISLVVVGVQFQTI